MSWQVYSRWFCRTRICLLFCTCNVTENVYDVNETLTEFSLKVYHDLLKNKEWFMSWINICWTWSFSRHSEWRQSRQKHSFLQGYHVWSKNKERMQTLINTCWTISYTVFMWICYGNTWISVWNCGGTHTVWSLHAASMWWNWKVKVKLFMTLIDTNTCWTWRCHVSS